MEEITQNEHVTVKQNTKHVLISTAETGNPMTELEAICAETGC